MRHLYLLVLCFALSACGQKGPLFRPAETAAVLPIVPEQVAPPAVTVTPPATATVPAQD